MTEDGDCARLGASIKYFNHRLSRYENAFDPDSKGLFIKQAFFFELAAAQWDSPRGKKSRRKRKKKKKEAQREEE